MVNNEYDKKYNNANASYNANLFLIGQMLQDHFNQLVFFQLYIRSSAPTIDPKLNLSGHKMAYTKLFVFAC